MGLLWGIGRQSHRLLRNHPGRHKARHETRRLRWHDIWCRIGKGLLLRRLMGLWQVRLGLMGLGMRRVARNHSRRLRGRPSLLSGRLSDRLARGVGRGVNRWLAKRLRGETGLRLSRLLWPRMDGLCCGIQHFSGQVLLHGILTFCFGPACRMTGVNRLISRRIAVG